MTTNSVIVRLLGETPRKRATGRRIPTGPKVRAGGIGADECPDEKHGHQQGNPDAVRQPAPASGHGVRDLKHKLATNPRAVAMSPMRKVSRKYPA